MRLFDRFRKKKAKDSEEDSSSGLLERLNANGFALSTEELIVTMHRVEGQIEYSKVLPEALSKSDIAELSSDGSSYRVHISMLAGKDQTSRQTIEILATTFATISELAKIRGMAKYVIKTDEGVGLMEVADYNKHPIHVMFDS
jgi:hypothetical protein